jgi:SAM-dependent methyltransferase
MDGIKTNFNDKEFDIVIASDILEHIKNDNIALKEWNRILKKNGKLIIFVPAFNFLWSGQDNVSNHYRRYSKSMLIKIIKKANFRIIRDSYWNFILFFPSLIFRLSIRIFLNKKNQKKDQFWALNPLLNNFLIYMLKFENLILKKLKFPVGISIFVVGLKN